MIWIHNNKQGTVLHWGSYLLVSHFFDFYVNTVTFGSFVAVLVFVVVFVFLQ